MIIAIPTNNSDRFKEVSKRSQNAAYTKFVNNAGYTPILVPMEADPHKVASIADGLLLAGGIDIDPIYYGYSNQASYSVDPDKDAAERAIFHCFRKLNKPVFGICRGFQLIMREFLHENGEGYEEFDYIENLPNHGQTGTLSVARRHPSHYIRGNVRTLFGLQTDTVFDMIPVNSMHHQAVLCYFGEANKLATKETKEKMDLSEPIITEYGDVELVAWSNRGISQPTKKVNKNNVIKQVPDWENYRTVVEAVKIKWGSNILGVQWHPEELGDIRILTNFFDSEFEAKGKTAVEGSN
jgi:putative glutamine amidotransferase